MKSVFSANISVLTLLVAMSLFGCSVIYQDPLNPTAGMGNENTDRIGEEKPWGNGSSYYGATKNNQGGTKALGLNSLPIPEPSTSTQRAVKKTNRAPASEPKNFFGRPHPMAPMLKRGPVSPFSRMRKPVED